ncbi:unnamed protein product [Brachionus calyciflorus]|uniref:Uncharacterized protein n=1 Tax=Brachionus calyciflorus TaxID=104777 RepID=A0A813Z317_9BILA|nr:unnamed protein product [Brachionus calyciflorus]
MNNVLSKPTNHRIINVTSCVNRESFDEIEKNDSNLGENVKENSLSLKGRNTLIVNRASSFENSNLLDNYMRPITARSLPTQVQSESSKLKPPKIQLINVNSKNFSNDNDDHIEQDNCSETLKHSVSSPTFYKIRKSSSKKLSEVKTNLDNYLEYSISPFTTKYEIIGNITKNQSTKLIDSVRKAKSSNNLNTDSLFKFDDIILPNQIHPINIQNSDDDSSHPNYLRINQNLFCGNVNSVKNERKLCKLNIEYLIDMTNLRPDELNRETLGKIPCICQKQHSRLFISIQITETDFKSLFNAFCEVNKFIQKSRKSPDKRVLIFGKEIFSPQVICAAAQYLMVEYEMSLETALKSVIQKDFSVIYPKFDYCYLNYLREFEKYLQHVSSKVFCNLEFNESEEKLSTYGYKCNTNLKAKRDMFEENNEFFNENSVYEFEDEEIAEDVEFRYRHRMHASMNNLKESDSENKRNTSLFNVEINEKNFSNYMKIKSNEDGKILKNATAKTSSLKTAWM